MFDVDGTLVRSNEMDDICFTQTIKSELGIAEPSSEWAEYEHVTDTGIVSALYQHKHRSTINKDHLHRFRDRFAESIAAALINDPGCCRALPGAHKILNELYNREGIALAIATGCWTISAQLKLDHAGFQLGNIPMVGSDHIMARAAIMQEAARLAEQAHSVSGFDKIVYVGDGSWDAKACQSLDWLFLGVGEGEQARLLADLGAAVVIPHYEQAAPFWNLIDSI